MSKNTTSNQDPLEAMADLLSPVSYSDYPAFAVRRKQLKGQRHDELALVYAQAREDVQHSRYTEDVEVVVNRRTAEINERYACQLMEARALYQVPLIQGWQAALSKTGKTRYHDAHLYSNLDLEATMEAQEDGRIRVEVRSVSYLLPEQVESHLTWSGGCSCHTWEALPASAGEDQQATPSPQRREGETQ